MMITLHHNDVWLQFNTFNIHREVSIEWCKCLSPTVTLQYHTKLRIENRLRNVKLDPKEIKTLTSIDISYNHLISIDSARKCKRTNYDDDHNEWEKNSSHPSIYSLKSFILITKTSIYLLLYRFSYATQTMLIYSKYLIPCFKHYFRDNSQIQYRLCPIWPNSA